MPLLTERYPDQLAQIPQAGQHVLAQYDDESIVVYQAYCPEIGHFAAEHGRFGGAFSFSRMTWIKPNFLWMMFRSRWGTKVDQEVTLAIRLRRSGFEEILRGAVASSFGASGAATREDWERSMDDSDVRLQWDPDHGPSGAPVERRAIQLGIRGAILQRFNDEMILSIEDISDFVDEQRRAGPSSDALVVPRERVLPLDETLRTHIGADQFPIPG